MKVHVKKHEVGLHFVDGELKSVLKPGKHRFWNLLKIRHEVQVFSTFKSKFEHGALETLIDNSALAARLHVLELSDRERALVWVDDRFHSVLGPGLHAFWKEPKTVRIETVTIDEPRFQHSELRTIVNSSSGSTWLDICSVDREHVGVLYIDGRFIDSLSPGTYAFWFGAGDARVIEVDTREMSMDVAGQELMTRDKVSLRLNAQVVYRVTDAAKAVSFTSDSRQSLYRDVQHALRAVTGARILEDFLVQKETLAAELTDAIQLHAEAMGMEVVSLGIRDVILPGEMKDLMNRVIEAQKAAEANLISRREETAAMRSQANTAKLLADNPTLMRLRELEVLEKIASAGTLNVVLGEKGFADRVINLL
ncbi:MAG: slipin family protein [Pirellulaceae bacterium]